MDIRTAAVQTLSTWRDVPLLRTETEPSLSTGSRRAAFQSKGKAKAEWVELACPPCSPPPAVSNVPRLCVCVPEQVSVYVLQQGGAQQVEVAEGGQVVVQEESPLHQQEGQEVHRPAAAAEQAHRRKALPRICRRNTSEPGQNRIRTASEPGRTAEPARKLYHQVGL